RVRCTRVLPRPRRRRDLVARLRRIAYVGRAVDDGTCRRCEPIARQRARGAVTRRAAGVHRARRDRSDPGERARCTPRQPRERAERGRRAARTAAARARLRAVLVRVGRTRLAAPFDDAHRDAGGLRAQARWATSLKRRNTERSGCTTTSLIDALSAPENAKRFDPVT